LFNEHSILSRIDALLRILRTRGIRKIQNLPIPGDLRAEALGKSQAFHGISLDQ
jgi:hypothetical protein